MMRSYHVVRNNKAYSEHTFRRKLLCLSFCCVAVLCNGGSILRKFLLACARPWCVVAAVVAVCTILLITRAARRLVDHGEGIWRLALGPERPQVVLPRVQHDDCLPLCHAVIDLVGVDRHVAYREGRPPRVAHKL